MQTLLVANISGGKSRKARFQDRDYIVAPVTLIVPGVLDGSLGPLLYPPDEVGKNPGIWNHVPIVVNHPGTPGDWVTARQVSILEKSGIGFIFNTQFKGGKLIAEAWVDVDKAAVVHDRVFAAINNQQPLEVSTGLHFDAIKAKEGAVHNGTPYTHSLFNFRPDHLAILPEQIGACSVADGCGLFVNSHSKKPNRKATTMDETRKKAVIDFIIANCAYCDEEDREAFNALSDEKLLKQEKALKDDKAKLEKATNAAKAAADKAKATAKPFKTADGVEHVFDEAKGTWNAKPKEEPKDKGAQNAAPALTKEQEEDLAFARQVKQERRDKAINAIKAYEGNKLTDERLAAMPLGDLQAVANSYPQKEGPVRQEGADNYLGAGAGTPPGGDPPKLTEMGSPTEYIHEAAASK
jgi:hypothetical protein